MLFEYKNEHRRIKWGVEEYRTSAPFLCRFMEWCYLGTEKDAPWHRKRYGKRSENRLHSANMEPTSRVQWSLFSDEMEPVFRCYGASFQSVWHIVLTRACAYLNYIRVCDILILVTIEEN